MKISVVLANYNHGSLLSNVIDSILEQSYSKWELVLVDDCSTDDSVNVIRDYSNRDPRINPIFLSKNIGSNLAYKHGLEVSDGYLIFFIAADDRLSSIDFFSDAIDAFHENPSMTGFYGKSEIVSGETGLGVGLCMGSSSLGVGYISGDGYVKGVMAREIFIPSSSVIWRREDYIRSDCFRLDLGPYADWYTNQLLPAENGVFFSDKVYTSFAVWKAKKNFGNSIGLMSKIIILFRVKKALQKNSKKYRKNKAINIWWLKTTISLIKNYYHPDAKRVA